MRLELWDRLAGRAGIALSDHQHAILQRYLDLLIETNQSINLTRIVDRADAQVRHVGDALSLLGVLPGMPTEADGPRRLALADVGTGGGVPGVPLAIARPDLNVTLIDSTKKKLDAVMKIVAALQLGNVRALHARLGPAGPHVLADPSTPEAISAGHSDILKNVGMSAPRFDVVVARAVADLSTLLEWCAPLMRANSVLLAMKGPRATEELAAAKRTLTRLRLRAQPVELLVPELPGHVVVRVVKG